MKNQEILASQDGANNILKMTSADKIFQKLVNLIVRRMKNIDLYYFYIANNHR